MTKQSNNRGVASIALVASLLAACGSEPKPAPPPAENAVSRDMKAPMDKARGVETTLQQEKDAMDRTLAEKEQPTAE